MYHTIIKSLERNIIMLTNAPSLDEFEKRSLIYSLRGRMDLLRAKKLSLENMLADLKLPLSPDEVLPTDKMINPPSFFQSTVQDIVQEIRGILNAHFAVYEKLAIINAPKAPLKRTKEQFECIRSEFIQYANKQLDAMVLELNENNHRVTKV
jgi:hypothetical protein